MNAHAANDPDAARVPDVTGLAEKRAFLESGAAWPGKAPPDCIETHASLVFLTRNRVWKLKKPVCLHHIDLRTLAAREHFCREELRLNRELAGEVYRRVDPLVRRGDGSLSIGGEGTVVDWLVEMRRLPSDEMLDRRLRAGPKPQLPEIERVSRRMIGFYRGARPVADAGAFYLERWLGEARTNAAHLREMREVLGGHFDFRLPERAIAMLEMHRAEILERGRRSLLIEGHGDLRPEHVCLETPPVIFDRVEFDPGIRLVDPFEEFNYLGLECAMAGAGWIRAVLLISLSQAGFEPPSPTLLAAYGVNRCLTRARLAADHLRDPDVRTPEKWPAQARAYLCAAARLQREDSGLRLTGALPRGIRFLRLRTWT